MHIMCAGSISDGYLRATFPDVPGVKAIGKNETDVKKNAIEALTSALQELFHDRRPLPMPSQLKNGHPFVELRTSIWAKIMMLREMTERGIKVAELARAMGKSRADMTRLVDLAHVTKIDTIADALFVLGASLELGLTCLHLGRDAAETSS